MVEGRRDDVVHQVRDPVDRLRHEGCVLHAQRHGQRVERVEVGATRRGVAPGAERRRRGRLLLGQPVDVVVVQQQRHVHVVADRVDPVAGADAAAVAVAGIDEHVQVGASHLDALRDGQGAAVNAVEAIGLHVVREAAGTADARHEHGLLRAQVFIPAQPLDGGQDGVVAAAGAPARHAGLVVLQGVTVLVHALEAVSRVAGHALLLPVRSSLERTSLQMSLGLIGWPRDSLQQSMSTR